MNDDTNKVASVHRLPQTPRIRCGLYTTPTGQLARIAGWTIPPPAKNPVAIVVAITTGDRYTVNAAQLQPIEVAHKMTIR